MLDMLEPLPMLETSVVQGSKYSFWVSSTAMPTVPGHVSPDTTTVASSIGRLAFALTHVVALVLALHVWSTAPSLAFSLVIVPSLTLSFMSKLSPFGVTHGLAM